MSDKNNTETDAARKKAQLREAQRRWRAARKAAGLVRVEIWCLPEDVDKARRLDRSGAAKGRDTGGDTVSDKSK